MLQVIGSVLVLFGCSGLGFAYRMDLYESIRQLRKIEEMFELMISEICYHNASLPECCRQVGLRMDGLYGEALLEIAAKLECQQGWDFASCWQEEMGKALSRVTLSKEEKKMVLDFALGSGFSHREMQIRTIQQYRDLVVSRMKIRENSLQQQGKMAAGLGVLGGLLLVILLL